MKGFIIAHGRSGTMWVAKALDLCTDLKARHESMKYEFGADFGGVESNGNFWQRAPELRRLYPGALVIHQVRDGRRVVRSVLSRKPKRTFEEACKRWDRRNTQMMEDVDDSLRFRLEELTTDFQCFERLAKLVGAQFVNPTMWQQIRSNRINAYRNSFPDPAEWTRGQKAMFWEACGGTMLLCGYGQELDG